MALNNHPLWKVTISASWNECAEATPTLPGAVGWLMHPCEQGSAARLMCSGRGWERAVVGVVLCPRFSGTVKLVVSIVSHWGRVLRSIDDLKNYRPLHNKQAIMCVVWVIGKKLTRANSSWKECRISGA